VEITIMTLDEARRTLREGTSDYVTWSTANAVIYANHMRSSPGLRTADAEFYTDQQISARLSRTPEGFLIARDAVLARTGLQEYHHAEIVDPNIEPDEHGIITVHRSADEVFAPRSLASFTGKPVTVGHPDDYVNGGNYRQHAVGHVMSARRGEGENEDTVTGDLFISDARAADAVLSGTHRALSVGYSASYRPMGCGRASQHDIVANHVALLPNGGARCGDRCVVRDSKPRETVMSRILVAPMDTKFERQLERIRRRFGTRDAAPPMDALQRFRTIDAARSQRMLAGINQRNREFWEKNSV
jgi:hypothetical protein